MQKNEQIASLDIAKIVFSLVVVAIHAKPFLMISDTFQWYFSNVIAALAVPFFFITSSFLFFSKAKLCDSVFDNKSYLYKYCLRLIKLYCIWALIWIPLKLLNYFSSGQSLPAYIVSYVKDFIIGDAGDALWFLVALPISIYIISLTITKYRGGGIVRYRSNIILSEVYYNFLEWILFRKPIAK